jgi:hypothetical protein
MLSEHTRSVGLSVACRVPRDGQRAGRQASRRNGCIERLGKRDVSEMRAHIIWKELYP